MKSGPRVKIPPAKEEPSVAILSHDVTAPSPSGQLEHVASPRTPISTLRFSRAIAANHTRVRVLGPDGIKFSKTGPFPIEDEPSFVFAVQVVHRDRYRCLPFDFDAKSGTLGDRVKAEAGAHALIEILDRCGIRWVLTQSGPTGGRHVLVTVRTGLDWEVVRDIAYRVGTLIAALDKSPLCGRKDRVIRPPGSLHKSGRGRSEVLLPVDNSEAIMVLEQGNAEATVLGLLEVLPEVPLPKLNAKERRRPPRVKEPGVVKSPPVGAVVNRPLTPRMRALLGGETWSNDSSRSGILHTFVGTGLRAGFTREELFELARGSSFLGDWLLHKPGGGWTFFMRSVRYYEATRDAARAVVAEVRQRADQLVWVGESGALQRKLLEVCFRHVENEGEMTFPMSLREAALRGGMADSTVVDVRDRLVDNGWLAVTDTGSFDRSACWTLLTNVAPAIDLQRSTQPPQPPHPPVFDARQTIKQTHETFLDHDAFRPAALGPAGWWGLQVLSLHPGLGYKKFAELTGVSASQGRRVLASLRKAGVVDTDRGHWSITDVSAIKLNKVAMAHGTRGAREAQRQRYDKAQRAQREFQQPIHEGEDLCREMRANNRRNFPEVFRLPYRRRARSSRTDAKAAAAYAASYSELSARKAWKVGRVAREDHHRQQRRRGL